VESQLLDLLARLEVNLDFNEDVVAVDRDRIGRVLEESRANLEELRGRAPWARRITTGATVALVGRPNVGKSSLFNALLQDDRALVAETPGTTRDYLEAWLDIAGIPVRLIDTAGVREAEGVEAEGVARAAKWDREADLRLRVFDATEPTETGEPREMPRDTNQLVCWNKLDLAEPPTGAAGGLFVSARTGRGISELRQSIADRLLEGVGREPADEVAPSERHEDAIRRATDALDRGSRAWRDGVTEEWLAGDVRDATAALGEITGRTAGEEVLDRIFSKFCIGK
jgi:tRNA modification GTPase